MEILKTLISILIPSIFWYLACSFICWDTDLANWSPLIRFMYLTLLIVTSIKMLENKN